jgi:hypothetical protein
VLLVATTVKLVNTLRAERLYVPTAVLESTPVRELNRVLHVLQVSSLDLQVWLPVPSVLLESTRVLVPLFAFNALEEHINLQLVKHYV